MSATGPKAACQQRALMSAVWADRLAFFGALAYLAEPKAFARHLAPVRKKRWVIYAKPPFAGPKAVLACLSRYTHGVAISSRRITAFDGDSVTFRIKDYRCEGSARHRTLTLEAGEFIRRFLLHVLPRGFHRIRHYGFLTGSNRKPVSRASVNSSERRPCHVPTPRSRTRRRHPIPFRLARAAADT